MSKIELVKKIDYDGNWFLLKVNDITVKAFKYSTEEEENAAFADATASYNRAITFPDGNPTVTVLSSTEI